MRKILFLISAFGCVVFSYAQIGIGTTTPNSTLVVEGSLETAYREVTASTTLTIADHYITYNGADPATITIPTAASGSNSFTGRIYKIKNISSQPLTIQTSGTEKMRNIDNIGQSSFVLSPGNYTELVNNATATGGITWDVSFITIPKPPLDTWQFENIYDYTATAPQDVANTESGTSLAGFNQSITIPANKQAKFVISYSIPLGNSTSNFGYFGVTLFKGSTELAAGSRKSTLAAKGSSAAYSMTTIGATVTDILEPTSTAQTITYSLKAYLEVTTGTTKYLMFSATDPNFNWGKGYWSIQVFLK